MHAGLTNTRVSRARTREPMLSLARFTRTQAICFLMSWDANLVVRNAVWSCFGAGTAGAPHGRDAHEELRPAMAPTCVAGNTRTTCSVLLRIRWAKLYPGLSFQGIMAHNRLHNQQLVAFCRRIFASPTSELVLICKPVITMRPHRVNTTSPVRQFNYALPLSSLCRTCQKARTATLNPPGSVHQARTGTR